MKQFAMAGRRMIAHLFFLVPAAVAAQQQALPPSDRAPHAGVPRSVSPAMTVQPANCRIWSARLPGEDDILCATGRTISRVHLKGRAVERLVELPHPVENQFSVSHDGKTVFLGMAGNLTELWVGMPQ